MKMLIQKKDHPVITKNHPKEKKKRVKGIKLQEDSMMQSSRALLLKKLKTERALPMSEHILKEDLLERYQFIVGWIC